MILFKPFLTLLLDYLIDYPRINIPEYSGICLAISWTAIKQFQQIETETHDAQLYAYADQQKHKNHSSRGR